VISLNPTLPVSHLFHELPTSFLCRFSTLELKNVLEGPLPCSDLLFHSSLSLLDGRFRGLFEEAGIAESIRKRRVRRFSLDVGPCFEQFSIVENRYVGIGRRMAVGEIEAVCQRQISYLKDVLPGDCEIAIENLNYYRTGAYEDVCEPEFYNNICRDCDVHMVMDVPHVQVSAHNMGEDVDRHLGRFDAALVREIHLSKMGFSRRGAIDLHGPPDGEEFELMRGLVQRARGSVDIVVEYYGDPAVLVAVYDELETYIHEKISHHPAA
jgi:hypothetical protein